MAHAFMKPVTVDAAREERHNSPSAVASITGGYREWLLGVLLGTNMILGFALFFEYRHQAQQQELKRYELSDFITTHFNPLEAQVRSDHDLIQAYGLQKIMIESNKLKR